MMHRVKLGLLASTFLTAISTGAFAAPCTEADFTPDFSNTVAGATDVGLCRDVTGTINGSSNVDPTDYFAFGGIISGHSYAVSYQATTLTPLPLHFEAYTGTSIATLAFLNSNAVVPTTPQIFSLGTLTDSFVGIGVVSDVAGSGYGFSEGYRVILTDTTPTVPEPASIALFSVGVMGLAATARRRRKKT